MSIINTLYYVCISRSLIEFVDLDRERRHTVGRAAHRASPALLKQLLFTPYVVGMGLREVQLKCHVRQSALLKLLYLLLQLPNKKKKTEEKDQERRRKKKKKQTGECLAIDQT